MMELKNKNQYQNYFGPTANEKWHLFLQDKNSKLPFQIENIGITYPNSKYHIEREDSNLYIFEYVVSGKGYLEFDDRIIPVSEGDLYVIEPHTSHADYSDKKDPYEKIWVNFTSTCFGAVFNAYQLNGINIFKDTNTRPYFDKLLLLAEKSNHSDDIAVDVADILFQMVHLLANKIHSPTSNISQEASKIKTILDNAVFKDITLDDIAKEIHYSKKQINRIFKKEFNQTPYVYYLNLKLNFAKKYLLMTDFSVKEISEKLHFDNQYYFSNLFKKKTGLSPLKYRQAKKSKVALYI